MYYLSNITNIVGNCFKTVMRNLEKELLDELRNDNRDENNLLSDDSDEELSEIWNISGSLTITDIGDNELTNYGEKYTSCQTHRNEIGKESMKEALVNNYMRYIQTKDVENDVTSDTNNQLDSRTEQFTCAANNQSVYRVGQSDDADDEDSDSECDSDSDDEMFDVCMRESITRTYRRKIVPFHHTSRAQYFDNDDEDDDDEDDDYKRPLNIIPMKRRYSVQESLRVRVLRSEAAKAMSSILKSKCKLDS